jgi:Flp pilus assembly pilin Flp
MKRLRQWLLQLVREQNAAEPTQYAIAIALIICAVIGGLTLLGNATNNQNNATSNMLQKAATPSSGS